MPLTVYKWNGYWACSRGHVSIELRDGTYISWWPERRTKKILCKPVDAMEHSNTTLQSDTEQFRREPDICIQLKTTLDHDKQIIDWWALFRADSKYDLLNNNCATVVYNALQICYEIDKPTNNAVWTPDDIEKISKRIYIDEVPSMESNVATETRQAEFSETIKSYVEVLTRPGSEYQHLEDEAKSKKSFKNVLKSMCCCCCCCFGPRRMYVLRQPSVNVQDHVI